MDSSICAKNNKKVEPYNICCLCCECLFWYPLASCACYHLKDSRLVNLYRATYMISHQKKILVHESSSWIYLQRVSMSCWLIIHAHGDPSGSMSCWFLGNPTVESIYQDFTTLWEAIIVMKISNPIEENGRGKQNNPPTLCKYSIPWMQSHFSIVLEVFG
jgi:hypothetical protein